MFHASTRLDTKSNRVVTTNPQEKDGGTDAELALFAFAAVSAPLRRLPMSALMAAWPLWSLGESDDVVGLLAACLLRLRTEDS